jgi:predicted TIM-barrel fold metal-dependent hydrolase
LKISGFLEWKRGGYDMKNDISKRAMDGDSFDDLDIVDSHCHMGPWYNFYFSEALTGNMLQDADRVGVKTMCIAPHAAISCDYKLGNRQVADAAATYPERVRGLLTLNPNMQDEIRGEIEAYYTRVAFAGVKLHPTLHQYSLADDTCSQIFELLKSHGGYVLCHTWEGHPDCGVDLCERLVRQYPEVAFVLGHAGGTGDGVRKSIRLVNMYENSYMDTSGFEYSNTWIEDIMCKVDGTKVLFGSDCPFHDIRSGISRILFAALEDDDKLKILGGNYRQMLSSYPKKVQNDIKDMFTKQS